MTESLKAETLAIQYCRDLYPNNKLWMQYENIMSSYTIKVKHRKTGEIHEIFCHDDYFGKHQYGYKTPDGYLDEKIFGREYEMLK